MMMLFARWASGRTSSLQRFALLLSHPPFYECFSSERTSCTSLAYPWRDWFNFTANRCIAAFTDAFSLSPEARRKLAWVYTYGQFHQAEEDKNPTPLVRSRQSASAVF